MHVVLLLQVSYTDNQPLLFLLEGSLGIISLLDETCLLKHGDDAGFLALVKKHVQPRADNLITADPIVGRGATAPLFCICHSAAASAVQYDAKGFVEKNRDALRGDAASSLNGSSNAVVTAAFKPPQVGELVEGPCLYSGIKFTKHQ